MSRYLIAFLIIATQSAEAVDILVDTTDGTGNSGDGACSLTEALLAANTNSAVDSCLAGSASNSDTILFSDDIFNILGFATIIPSTTLSVSAGDLRIVGPAEKTLSVSGNLARQIMVVNQAPGDVLEFRNITMRDGFRAGALDGYGGGVDIQDGTGTLILDTVRFINNMAEIDGGGIHVSMDDAIEISISNSTFQGNEAGGSGGGIQVNNSAAAHMEVDNSHFLSNSSISGGALRMNGDVSGAPISLAVSDSTFEENSCFLSGGAIRFSDLTTDVSSVEIINSRFTMNVADGGAGGAITTSQDDEDAVSIHRSSFVENEGFQAGALFLSGAPAILENNSFILNTATEHTGGALLVSDSAALTSNTFYRNEAFNESFMGFQVGDLYVSQSAADGGVRMRGNLFDSLNVMGLSTCVLEGTAMQYTSAYNIASSMDCLIADGTSGLESNLMMVPTTTGHPIHTDIVRPETSSPAVDFVPQAQCLDEPALQPLVLDMLGDRRDSMGVPFNGNPLTPTGCDAGALELRVRIFSDGFEATSTIPLH